MTYTYDQLPKYKKPGDKIWAFHFNPNKSKMDLLYYQTPIKGVIYNPMQQNYITNNTQFIPIGKLGKLSKSKAVHLSARIYADTEQEAIDGFNQLIKEQIRMYEEQIEKLKSYMI